MTPEHVVAIDPMAMILHGNAYLIWITIHNPNTPAAKTLEQLATRLTAAERKDIHARAKAIAAYGNAVAEAMKVGEAAKA
jgi:hypothetical protein